jgi:hypothetical protein
MLANRYIRNNVLLEMLFSVTAFWQRIFCLMFGEPGSSVSIVSGYGLDDRVIEIRPPAEAKGFFL